MTPADFSTSRVVWLGLGMVGLALIGVGLTGRADVALVLAGAGAVGPLTLGLLVAWRQAKVDLDNDRARCGLVLVDPRLERMTTDRARVTCRQCRRVAHLDGWQFVASVALAATPQGGEIPEG